MSNTERDPAAVPLPHGDADNVYRDFESVVVHETRHRFDYLEGIEYHDGHNVSYDVDKAAAWDERETALWNEYEKALGRR